MSELECDRCGTTERVKRRPHSTAEIGDPDNPPLCPECNANISR